MIYGNCVGGMGIERTYIIRDEAGNEFPAVMVENETVFDATANDIRLGKVAATNEGITEGTKEIPAYHTFEAARLITAGSAIEIPNFKNCEFTKLQAIICRFNTGLTNSVAAEKISINSNVYAVNSTELLSTVTVDVSNFKISFGLKNESNKPLILRYFTYKEVI